MKFHEVLKTLRATRKVTQLDVARAIGFTDRAMRKYESGGTEPKMSALIVLARYFNVSIDYLTGESDDPSRH